MTDRVAVVTDSTAYLPDSLRAEWGVEVVPVQVVIGGQPYDEGKATPSDVARALREWVPVTTSRPSPRAFLDAYEELASRGATAIVSAHLSADLSSTLESALIAARDCPVPVHCVDTRTIGMAQGFAVLAGARRAAEGAGADEVAEAVRRTAQGSAAYFYVDTLEYLRRGGRIGTAAALLGSALAVKPLLHVVDGRVEPLEKVRTSSRALARLEEVAVARAGGSPVDVAVHHLDDRVRAEALAQRLRSRVPGLRELVVCEVGAVVGTHVGPGMLAVVVAAA